MNYRIFNVKIEIEEVGIHQINGQVIVLVSDCAKLYGSTLPKSTYLIGNEDYSSEILDSSPYMTADGTRLLSDA